MKKMKMSQADETMGVADSAPLPEAETPVALWSELLIQGGMEAADGAADGGRRGDLLSEKCASRDVFKHVTSRWGGMVLIALMGGTLRFSALRRRIGGVSERMLAQTLQWLEEDGLVLRIAFDVVPPHVEYSLTPMGAEAAEKVRALADWVETAMPRVTQAWQSKGKIPA